jgi:hypothetical protein
MFGLADAGNKPLSSAKVKRGARMTAARQFGTLCERDHIAAREGGDSALAAIAIESRTAAYGIPRFRGVCRSGPGHEAGYLRERVVGLIGNRLHRPNRALWFCRNGRFYSVRPPRPCRGQLSQLVTTSQAVDGQRAWFDNAESVE